MRSAGMKRFRQRKRNRHRNRLQRQRSQTCPGRKGSKETDLYAGLRSGSKIWNTRKQMPKIWYLMLSTNFPLLQVMMRKPPFLQGSRLPSPVSPLFQRKVSGMLPRLKKRRKKPRKKARLKCRYNPSSVSCAPALSKEQYKWNNAEIYGPGGRGDEN